MTIVLIGPPGAGKSTVGAIVAERLGLELVDTDTEVERSTGRSIPDIFVDDGEATFRELEREAVVAALGRADSVVVLGGGAPMDPRTEADLLGIEAPVVFLDVSLAAVGPRVGLTTSRPLLIQSPRAQWKALMDTRRPVYQRIASHIVETDRRTPDEVALAVADASRRPQPDSGAIGSRGPDRENRTDD